MGDGVSQVHPEKGRDIAHKHTDYPRWRAATAAYEVQYRMPYEPYFVTNKRVPRYDAGFLGYGNDKTEHCREIFAAKIKYMVLPEAFVFHMNHPRGDWLSSDQPWVSRSRVALSRFLVEVQDRYGTRTEGEVEVMVGEAGENCTRACERRGKGCRMDLARHINTCEALLAAFGDRCKDGCRRVEYRSTSNFLPSPPVIPPPLPHSPFPSLPHCPFPPLLFPPLISHPRRISPPHCYPS